MKKYSFLWAFFFVFVLCIELEAKKEKVSPKKPRLVIPIVIDQGAALLFKKIWPHVSQGLYKFKKKGFLFEKAFFPHACPNTAAGHAGLSTGTYPDVHGIIDNKFLGEDGVRIESDNDESSESFVFTPEGDLYEYGKSTCHLKADTLVDQTLLGAEYPHLWKAASFAIKSRAAIMTAGHQGEAFWMDPLTGALTTSKAYFQSLPEWVKEFNKEHGLNEQSSYFWRPFLPLKSEGYKKRAIENYQYSSSSSLFGTVIRPDLANQKEPFDSFTKSPWGIEWTFDAAAQYIENMFTENESAHLLAWISMSSIDRAGHMFGPSSQEVIDLMYYFDAELQHFMNRIYAIVPPEEVLFVITADHGIFEIPEVLNVKGFKLPERILIDRVLASMNNLIKKMYGIENLFVKYDAPHFYADPEVLQKQEPKIMKKVCASAISFLKKIPGVRNAWTPDELLEKMPLEGSFEYRFKRQIFPGRNGQIMILPHPYVMITNYPRGTSHATPYWYDVHVPLMFYQKNRWHGQKNVHPVSVFSLAASLAQVMEVELPSAAEKKVLPGLFKTKH